MNKGFTLIEIIVSIGIIALLSAVLLTYNRAGERQIILFKEQAKVISILSRAKSLSISAFGQGNCGYGVHLEAPRTFLIFKDIPSTVGDCSSADKKYSGTGTSEKFDNSLSFTLDSAVEFDSSLTTLSDIIFIPPDMSVVINSNLTKDSATITVKTSDNSGSSAKIKVNNAGQISG